MTDWATSDLRAYERQQDAAEGRMRRVRVMVADLLEGECDPYEWGNLAEAMQHIDTDGVAMALSQRQFAKAGETLDQLVRQYWEDRAWKQAANDIDQDDGL